MAKLSDRAELIYDLLSTTKKVISNVSPYVENVVYDVENDIICEPARETDNCIVRQPSGRVFMVLNVILANEEQHRQEYAHKAEVAIRMIEVIQDDLAHDRFVKFETLNVNVDPDSFISIHASWISKENYKNEKNDKE